MSDTKVAFIVRDDLPTWQRLNVVAFLATGVATAAPEIMGEPFVDAAGHPYGKLSGQPMLIFEADLAGLQKARRTGLARELTVLPYVFAMFSTYHGEANREAFCAERSREHESGGPGLARPEEGSGQGDQGPCPAQVSAGIIDE